MLFLSLTFSNKNGNELKLVKINKNCVKSNKITAKAENAATIIIQFIAGRKVV